MVFDKSLLKVLACPDCRGDIVYQKPGIQESLKCQKCHRVFAIKDSIPIMLPKDSQSWKSLSPAEPGSSAPT